jgi:predicted metalloenzyme YecM
MSFARKHCKQLDSLSLSLHLPFGDISIRVTEAGYRCRLGIATCEVDEVVSNGIVNGRSISMPFKAKSDIFDPK